MKLEIALAASPILYHILKLEHATVATKNDRLRLAPIVGKKFETDLGEVYPFFLSLARNRSNDYFENNRHGHRAIFVLDGVKLGHNYRIEPVNYWHNSAHNTDHENEDRLYSAKPFIPLFRYLKEVHIVVDPNWSGGENLGLLMACKKKNVPVFQYENSDDLIRLDKRKAIKAKAITAKPKKANYDYSLYEVEALWKALRTDFQAHPEFDNGKPSVWATMLKGVKTDKQKKARRAMIDRLQYGFSETDFSNIITGRGTEASEKYVAKIVQFMRKHRMNISQTIEFMRNRWYGNRR